MNDPKILVGAPTVSAEDAFKAALLAYRDLPRVDVQKLERHAAARWISERLNRLGILATPSWVDAQIQREAANVWAGPVLS